MFVSREVACLDAPKSLQLRVSWPVALAAILSLALYLHSLLWWTEPRDWDTFLGPWFEHLLRFGPVGAFAHPFSNYTPTYLYLLAIASLFDGALAPMYLVKLLSVAGTIFAAVAVADLIKTCGGRPRWALLVFILPSAVINSALLAQCDALWAGACILAVSAMIGGRTVHALIWCGVAIAFKAQSAFIAPFIIGALIGRRAPLWQWAIPPLVVAALMAPALLAGWPAQALAMIYPGQAVWADWPGRLANPWIAATIFAPEAARSFYWLGYAAVGVVSVAIAAATSASVHNRTALLLLALLSSLALPFLFPNMLERYFFLADLLALAAAVALRTRESLLIALAVQAASLLSLLTYMYFYAWPYPTLAGALLSAAALGLIVVALGRCGARWPGGAGRTHIGTAQAA